MNAISAPHPLDAATRLTPGDNGLLSGHTHPAYANMVGPFGGVIASTMLNAALTHPARLGDPVGLTVNYAGPIGDGGFQIDARPVRTNRSTQHWTMSLTQGDEVATTATAFFATRRDTWSATEARFPDVPPAASLAPVSNAGRAVWVRNYDMRFVRGPLPDLRNPPVESDSMSLLWVRDLPPRPLDFVSLAAICDVFFPRIIVRRAKLVPVGTVSITSYFHADSAMLARHGDAPLLGLAKASHFGKGYHDQSAEIWSGDGVLLATSHQIVYYKE